MNTPASESRATRVCLGDVISPRNDIIHPRDNPSGSDVFVGLEHIEPGTGRRIGRETVEKSELTGRKARFRAGDIVYGYLRPYLNKVWLADFDGLCSVDQYVYVVDQRQADAEYIAWFMRSPLFLSRAPVDSGPGQLPRIRLDEIARVELDLPALAEQKRVAARLREQLDTAARMRVAAEAQANAGARLAVATHWTEFAGMQIHKLPLTEHAIFLPARSTTTTGDALVPVATSGCLSPSAFNPSGVVMNRMWSSDLEAARLRRGEVLVARSNTADLVGQSAMYDGRPEEVYAADLTIRLWPHPGVDARYLAHSLTFVWSTGYWRERAAGASWTMKKLSRRLLGQVAIPVPSLEEQRLIVRRLDDRLRRIASMNRSVTEQATEIGCLPAGLLRCAFLAPN